MFRNRTALWTILVVSCILSAKEPLAADWVTGHIEGSRPPSFEELEIACTLAPDWEGHK